MTKKTLLYLASGSYQSEYENLPYHKIILIDRDRNFNNQPLDSKIEYWRMEVVEALEKLQKDKIYIDAVVMMNEGMHEGGGSYALYSDFIMGLLHSVVREKFLLITSLDYYSTVKLRKIILKMDWGFEIIREIARDEHNYIDPKIFDSTFAKTNLVDEKFGEVFEIKKIHNKVYKKFKYVDLNIIHGSIWSDLNSLDTFGFKFTKRYITNSYPLNYRYTKAYCQRSALNYIDLSDKTIEDILKIIYDNKNMNMVGLCPWQQNNYKGVIDKISNFYFDRPIKINFYHLNKNDYKDLYRCILKKSQHS